MPDCELKDLITGEDIQFYKDATKLSINAGKADRASEKAWCELNSPEDSKYLWRLERHLGKQAKYLSIKGSCLEDFLAKTENVPVLAEFVLGIHVSKCGTKVHIDVDVDKISKNYAGEKKGELVNLLGTARIDVSRWLRHRSVFERDWNLALCSAWQGFLGSPGYEWPRTAKAFDVCCAEHAEDFVIGTKGQLFRYKSFADKYYECGKEILKTIAYFDK